MESRNRYQSRILREMHQNRENPFNSPPSSTGSHGTVTVTSDLSVGPQGESTRRYDDSIMLPGFSNKQATARGTHPQSSPNKVNTSAIGRDFPEWKGWNTNEHTDDIYNVTGDYENQAKENIPPSSSTVNSPSQIDVRKAAQGTFGTRAHMQARVDDYSDHSDHSGSILGRRQPGSASRKHAGWKPQRGNVTSLIQTLKAAQAAKESTPKRSSPKHDDRTPSANRQPHVSNIHISPTTPNQTARSFFLPNLEHVNDLVSGVLRLSSLKNGIPVFVKHGKVHDREAHNLPDDHAALDAIDIPKDEQQIFVSLDKIREEIQALQAHDDQVTRQAEQLQEEVYELQSHMAKSRSRKDSAMGSDSESSMVDYLNGQKSQLEEKVATLQAKLDKANRKISINEIHTESYVTERDEALRSTTVYLERISNLQAELDSTRHELKAARGGTAGKGLVDDEIKSLREENISLRSQYKTMLDENQSLRSHNGLLTQENTELRQEIKRLQRLLGATEDDRNLLHRELEEVAEEKRVLREDHLSLERHNERFYNDNKSLQQKVTLLERRVHDLQENNTQMHQVFDTASNKAKPVKVTRIIEPTTARSRSTFSEVSAKSTTEQLDTQAREDFTQQIDLTQGSDFDVLPKEEMNRLREALRKAQADNNQQTVTEDYLEERTGADYTEDASQSLPPPFIPSPRHEASKTSEFVAGKRQPSGILKNAQALRSLPDQDTGRFSVKSAMSGMSVPSQTTRSEISLNRRHSDSVRFDLDLDENMTSALFIDDITLDKRARVTQKEKEKDVTRTRVEPQKPIRALSADAKRVLDSLCDDHDCRNCVMCVRINSHLHESEAQAGSNKKKTIIVQKPIPVTDRVPNPTTSDADHTMRPLQQPGLALATVMKMLQDELAHFRSSVARKRAQLVKLDPSFGQRQRKQLHAEIARLTRLEEMKSDQIYRLNDVLEGQKQGGQQMSQTEVEITIDSILAVDDTWDGILD
ncbi:hypothetical protein JX266_012406 [Neoarthrinium moseri]|uniref:uncharacterized protein n=1 Tax=Neoarthrinium moseri TaxID=1658444 RepID=UPI001FDC31F2|nr:uncharacterized protein JN550_009814 [Neoarthrinium moseri]KAI1841395.1 hypothetical protein JX266_012406 [Neoarthrinium moseri]KAI1863078.1 hypothetical protein JN550_009814 [Neoarthrinium moseri]